MREAVYQILTTNTGVTNLVGARIFPKEAPEDTNYPLIIFEITGTERDGTMSGPSPLVNINLTVFALSKVGYEEANTLRDKVRIALNGYPRDDRSDVATVAGVPIQNIQAGSDSETFIPPDQTGEADGVGFYLSAIDFSAWYTEALN